MSQGIALASAMVVVGFLAQFGPVAQAPSLEEQFEAQYQVTDLSRNPVVAGSVLVLQKDGVFGVPTLTSESPTAAYRNGVLYPPRADAMVRFGRNIRPLQINEKVYLRKIEVNLREDWIKLFIIECGACNGAPPAESYKSVVSFEFTKGYLQSASALDVEETIAQVLELYAPPKAPPASVAPAPGPAGESSTQTLSNDDVIQLVQAKQSDSLIIKIIQSSECAFDTSAEGFAKLTVSGVSGAVRQAMADAASRPRQVPRSALEPAVEAMQARDFARAASRCTALLRQYPGAPQLYEMRAQAYSLERQTDLAIADYAQAIKLEPRNPMLYLHRAWIYSGQAEFELALHDLDRAVELAPSFAQAHLARASVRDKLFDFRGELADLDAVIRLEPGMPMARRERAEVLRRLGGGGSPPPRVFASEEPEPPTESHPVSQKGPAKPVGPPETGIHMVADDVTAPVGLHTPDAPYTPQAKKAWRAGSVKLEIVVDVQGNVTEVKEVSPQLGLGLDESAMETVRKWKFKPATTNGVATPVRIVVEFHFAPS